jgi:hypothetical protein
MENEFISKEERHFPFRIGKSLASALAGFVAGALFTAIIFMVAFYLSQQYAGN